MTLHVEWEVAEGQSKGNLYHSHPRASADAIGRDLKDVWKNWNARSRVGDNPTIS